MDDKAFTRSKGPVVQDTAMDEDEGDRAEYEREERKERLKRKEKECVEELRKSQAMSSVQPLGCDRLFRRYWLFTAIKGLFIEENEFEIKKLLQPNDIEEEEVSVLSNSPNNDVKCENVIVHAF